MRIRSRRRLRASPLHPADHQPFASLGRMSRRRSGDRSHSLRGIPSGMPSSPSRPLRWPARDLAGSPRWRWPMCLRGRGQAGQRPIAERSGGERESEGRRRLSLPSGGCRARARQRRREISAGAANAFAAPPAGLRPCTPPRENLARFSLGLSFHAERRANWPRLRVAGAAAGLHGIERPVSQSDGLAKRLPASAERQVPRGSHQLFGPDVPAPEQRPEPQPARNPIKNAIIAEPTLALAGPPLGGIAALAMADVLARARPSGAAADCRAQRKRKGV
jgi:hypothetical protein